jgi:hypothetical protein
LPEEMGEIYKFMFIGKKGFEVFPFIQEDPGYEVF